MEPSDDWASGIRADLLDNSAKYCLIESIRPRSLGRMSSEGKRPLRVSMAARKSPEMAVQRTLGSRHQRKKLAREPILVILGAS
ncbi:hypothetical protein RRSWK_00145 [Rhodopirellula sp. SWK7]|nr:hypothetical protein RRSWK_00145 [Rhodopirellula sp. SWK7]